MGFQSQWKALGDSTEWKILLASASSHAASPNLSELLRSPDWNGLLELAEEHGVTNLLAGRLRASHGALVPPGFQKQVLEAQRSHVLSGLSLIAEMIRALDRCRAADLPVLVLKGPALSMQAYGDATVRQYGDVDLLVRHDDMSRATQLMIEAGFVADVPPAAVMAGRIPGEYVFSRPNTKVIVELHTERTLRYFPNRLAIEKLFSRRAMLNFNGHEVPTLSVEDALVSMCTHGAKHLWERLMWIADVAAMIERQPSLNWDATIDIAKEMGAERIVHTGLLLASNLLRTELPRQAEERVRGDQVANKLVGEVETWLPAAGQASPGLLGRALFRARMRGGLLPGIWYVTRLSLSPTEEDWREGQEHKSSGFRETARRLIRLAGKYGRAPSR